MNVRALWAAVALASVVLVCVTILLALHVDPTAVISVISIVAVPVIGAVLYGKVETISQQTNGNTTRLTDLLTSVVEHLKTHNTIPADLPPNTTVTTSSVVSPPSSEI